MKTALPFLGLAALLAAPGLAQTNDECATAIAVGLGTTPFDTTNTVNVTASLPAFLCDGNTGADIWFSFTAPASQVYRFDVCSADYDTILEVHQGPCGSGNVLGCSDDHCGLQSWTTVVCTAGVEYFVRVGGWGGARGIGDLEITEAFRPLQLVARYRLDEPNGTSIAQDDSGNGQVGVYNNVVQGGAGAAPGTGSSAGFDGSTAYVEIPSASRLDDLQNDFSASAWFRVPQLPIGFSVNRIFGNEGPAGSWSMGIDGGSRLVFTSHTVRDYQQPVTIVPNQWHHMAVVMDYDADVTFYFDGVPVGTLANVEQAERSQGVWVIGAWSPFFSVPEYFRGDIDDVQVYQGQLDAGQVASLFNNPGSQIGVNQIGTSYCTAVVNQAGLMGQISAFGSNLVGTNDVTLVASDVPPQQFGIFIVGRTQGFVPSAGGSNGNLCLSGAIGRYSQPGQIKSTGTMGTFELVLDLTQIPLGSVPVAAMSGDTFNFQAWHREGVGGGSNFTNGVSVLFQ